MSKLPTEIQFSKPWFGPEEETAVVDVLRSGWVVAGHNLQEFEAQFAERCGAAHAVGMSSWTTAAFLVLKCLGIGPGDEVIVPSLTFIASANVIRHVGATPVFADIEPDTWTMSVNDTRRRITTRTKAILPVDQLGMPCDLPAFTALAEDRELILLDDAACGLGSSIYGRPVGSFGVASVFSLHARKVITTGEGGMVVTNDAVLAERLRRQRHQGMSLSDLSRHGVKPTLFETYEEVGYNFRTTDIQAAIGVIQMSRLDEAIRRRRVLAERYSVALENNPMITLPAVPAGYCPNWQSYQIILREGGTARRNELMDHLFYFGIPVRRGVMACHLEACYAGLGKDLPVTEAIAARSLQLPMHPQLTFEQQDFVIATLNQFAAGRKI